MVYIGIVGGPNKGKSTLFNAITMGHAEMANYPFTTIDANKGIAYIKEKCPCKELDLKCNPNNSKCVKGFRFIPINIIDVAGLVPDAHKGKGLGNKFLTDLALADCLIQVIDLSGSTDLEGKLNKINPEEEILFLEKEISHWIKQIIEKNWNKIRGKDLSNLKELLKSFKITERDVEEIVLKLNLKKEKIDWDENKIFEFSEEIRKKSKPILIAANKYDLQNSEKNLEMLKKKFPEKIIIPISAEIELSLKKAEKLDLIEYVPGENKFEIKHQEKMNKNQIEALNKMDIFLKNKGTGVQKLINTAAFEFLDMIVIYPVEDENKLTNNKGNVLPDAVLLKKGSTAFDLAKNIHTDLADNFIRAIDVKTKRIIGKDHILKHNDIIKIISKT